MGEPEENKEYPFSTKNFCLGKNVFVINDPVAPDPAIILEPYPIYCGPEEIAPGTNVLEFLREHLFEASEKFKSCRVLCHFAIFFWSFDSNNEDDIEPEPVFTLEECAEKLSIILKREVLPNEITLEQLNRYLEISTIISFEIFENRHRAKALGVKNYCDQLANAVNSLKPSLPYMRFVRKTTIEHYKKVLRFLSDASDYAALRTITKPENST